MSNKKGKGYLFKRNGVWYVRVKVNGKDICKSLKTGDKATAENRYKTFTQSIVIYDKLASLNYLKAQIETEEQKIEKTERIMIKDMLNQYFASCFCGKITPDTKCNYTSMVGHFVRWFNKPYMADVTSTDAIRFTSDMKSVLADERLFATISCLKRIWAFAMQIDNNIKSNVWIMKGYKFRKDKTHKRREMTHEEVNRLLVASQDQQFEKYWAGEVHMLFELGAFTSLRLSDCVSLRWNEIHGQIIKKLPKKTAKEGVEAVIPVCTHLADVLMGWRKIHPTDEYVLPILSHLHRRKINKLVHRVFGLAGIAITETDDKGHKLIKTGFHGLRVYALSNFLRVCGDINVVKTIAAHKNADMTLWYTHCQERDVINAFQKGQSSLSADILSLIASAKSENETADDFIRRLIADRKELPYQQAC